MAHKTSRRILLLTMMLIATFMLASTMLLAQEETDLPETEATAETDETVPAVEATKADAVEEGTLEDRNIAESETEDANAEIEEDTDEIAKDETESETEEVEKEKTPAREKHKTDGLWIKSSGNEDEEAAVTPAVTLKVKPTLLEPEMKFRIEASFAVDFLIPFDTYGTWETLMVGFFHTPIPNLTYYFKIGAMWQKTKGVGYLGAGVYIDWTYFLTTITEISTGLYAQFYPVLTAHHEFNFHILEDPGLSLILGVTYIQSKKNIKTTNRTLIPQAGLALTLDKWVLEYRLSVDIAFPGTHVGLAHLLSVNYGEDGKYQCYLTVHGGKSSYLEEIGTDQEKVNNTFVGASVGHRHWIKRNWGLFGEARYLWLKDDYSLIGFMFGGFYAW